MTLQGSRLEITPTDVILRETENPRDSHDNHKHSSSYGNGTAGRPLPASHLQAPGDRCDSRIQGIIVSWTPTSSTRLSEEILRLYFENKHKTGGGDIQRILVYEDDGAAYISYDNPTGISYTVNI